MILPSDREPQTEPLRIIVYPFRQILDLDCPAIKGLNLIEISEGNLRLKIRSFHARLVESFQSWQPLDDRSWREEAPRNPTDILLSDCLPSRESIISQRSGDGSRSAAAAAAEEDDDDAGVGSTECPSELLHQLGFRRRLHLFQVAEVGILRQRMQSRLKWPEEM